jgi:glycerol uptake facilitator-like aquaporin
MRQYLTEFLGTFFLVLTVALAVPGGSALAVYCSRNPWNCNRRAVATKLVF